MGKESLWTLLSSCECLVLSVGKSNSYFNAAFCNIYVNNTI
jgi:hypothetical protein